MTSRPNSQQGARAARRRNQRAGNVPVFDAVSTFKLDYDLRVPGGPLRDHLPSRLSGTIIADSEADCVRGIIVKMMEAFGYTRVARAVTGLFCEAINPMSQALRSMIALGIAQGTGLVVTVENVTSCADCGAEYEHTDIIDPNAEEGAELETTDDTIHAENCPARMPIYAEGEEPTDMSAPKPVEYRTGPAILVLHPHKYKPLTTPKSAAAQPGNDVEPEQEATDVTVVEAEAEEETTDAGEAAD